MGDSINALLAQTRGGGGTLPAPVVVDPLAALQAGQQAATTTVDLRQKQFNLQQAQLAPAYQAMRQLNATNPNPTDEDVNAALGAAKRIGGNVDGLVNNYTDWRARGGKPADFVRAYALGGMSPENQVTMSGQQPVSVETGAGTAFGTRGGPLSAAPGQFNPNSFVQQGFTPREASELIPVQDVDANGRPTGTYHLAPRSTVVSPTGGFVGAGAGGGGGAAGGTGGAPPSMYSAIQGAEGSGPNASSYAGAKGTMQVTQPFFNTYAKPGESYDNEADRVAVARRGIDALWQKYNGDPARVATAYFSGEKNVAPPGSATPWVNAGGDRYNTVPQYVAGVLGRLGAAGGGGGATGGSGPFIGATTAQPAGGGGATNVQPAGGGGVRYFSPTGQPVGPGGGGGPTFAQPAPWMGPIWEQSAKEYSELVSREAGLAQRIQPYQTAISIIDAHPDLKTGPTSGQWNNWATTLSQWGVQLPSMPGDSVAAYQELTKALHQGLVNSGAFSGTDMARIEAEASMPNPQQKVDAIRELSARQIGLERFQLARLKYFRSLHPGEDPDQYANQFRGQTSQWASNLDPVAFGADKLTDQDIATYLKGLNPADQQRFRDSVAVAAKQYPDFAKAGK
jgi:hypothetical protein